MLGEEYALKRGRVAVKIVLKVCAKYVINLFSDQQNLPEILEVTTLDVLFTFKMTEKEMTVKHQPVSKVDE